MDINQKALRFLTALTDVYRDEEGRELAVFSKLDLNEDMTEDMTAILIAAHVLCERITGFDGDLVDFTHTLNKLAIQCIMDPVED